MTKTEQWTASNPLRRAIFAAAATGELRPEYRTTGVIRAAAKKLRVSRTSLHNWLAGVYAPSLDHFEKITSVFGLGRDEYQQWWDGRPKRRG